MVASSSIHGVNFTFQVAHVSAKHNAIVAFAFIQLRLIFNRCETSQMLFKLALSNCIA
jgi:hypothetical protein